ncbi:MAG: polysaccharide deacetylase family protein [Oscillospiraceae bacterium]|jgi:polysaccharide deacetylase family sporulation protein PdaB|nr:polysaccharide deacetylase family protein [Oscillospiraceae bacterium]
MRYLVINKRQVSTFIAIAVFALVLFSVAMGSFKIEQTVTKNKKIPIYAVSREEKLISLTFDAAWGNDDTKQLIDVLGKHEVKATFFIVGNWARKFPQDVKAFADAGHEIANHSNTHAHMAEISKEKVQQELELCSKELESITGVKPILHRAPYGEYSNTLLELTDALKMKCIQWDVDSLDYRGLSADQIQKRVLERVKPGSIILFHNGAKSTPAALDGLITSLKAQGYKIVPVSENIYMENYTLDNSGRQHLITAS